MQLDEGKEGGGGGGMVGGREKRWTESIKCVRIGTVEQRLSLTSAQRDAHISEMQYGGRQSWTKAQSRLNTSDPT